MKYSLKQYVDYHLYYLKLLINKKKIMILKIKLNILKI